MKYASSHLLQYMIANLRSLKEIGDPLGDVQEI